MSKPIETTDDTFERIVKSNKLLIVDFWAPWCGPCKMFSPVIDQLAAEYAGKITFAKLNIDENPRTASEFGVMSIPTVLIMKNGKLVDQIVGAVTKQQMATVLQKYVAKK
jgi:thioredoxin 1